MGSVAAKGFFLLVILAIVGFGLYLANWDAPAPTAPEVIPVDSKAFVGKTEAPPIVQTPSVPTPSGVSPAANTPSVDSVPVGE